MRDRIGRYEIIYPIAQGGMAEVFAGRLPGMAGFEKLVAIKLIHAHLCKEQQFIQMFLDEARLAASIRHPNVAEIFEVGREGELYFMIAELVLGQDLHALMRRTRQRQEPFPEGLSSHIVSQVCLGLHEAHQQKDKDGQLLGLVHRDVTPRNILLSYGGFTKLADFGVAWAQNKLGHSEAGSLKGKVGFISPEQIRNEPVDRRCDIFSLGVVFYMMLTGRHPFQGDNDAATINNILAGTFVRPSELNPEISPDVESIVLTALASSPEDRYQTAAQLHEELEEAIQVHDYKPTPGRLSRLMHKLFAEEIAEHERKLREYHRERGEDTGIKSVPPPPMEGESQPKLAAGIPRDFPFGPDGGIAEGSGDGGSRPKEGAPSRRRGVRIAAGLGVVAVIIAVVVFAVGSGESAAESAEGPMPEIAKAESTPPSPEPEEPAADASGEPEEIRLDLGALPVGAVITLDDEAIQYPFVVPWSGNTGNLKITAPGYRPFEASIPLDRDREVAVLWEKEPPKPRSSGSPRLSAGEGKPKGKQPGEGKDGSSEKEVLLPSPFD